MAWMLPIEEYGQGKNRTYGTWYRNSSGELYAFMDGSKRKAYLHSQYPYLYYGRGYVQLTWYFNYENASKKIGVDFLNNPDLVMNKNHAVKIMVQGMKDGWFTGKKLSDYINQSKKDYLNARRIINGTDKDKLISGYAETFEKALRSMWNDKYRNNIISVISIIQVGQEIYRMIAEYMDEMDQIKQSGADKKTRVMAYARSAILKAGKDWDLWKGYIDEFIDSAKAIYNAVKGILK